MSKQVGFNTKAAEFNALANVANGMKADIDHQIVSWHALYHLQQALEGIASASKVLGKLQNRFAAEMSSGNVAAVIANIEALEKVLARIVPADLKNDLAFAGRNYYVLSSASHAARVVSELAAAVWERAELEQLDEIHRRCDAVVAKVREWIDPARPRLEFAVVKVPFQSGMQWFGADWRFEVSRYEESIQVMSQTLSTGFSAEKYEKHFTSEWL